LAGIRLSHVSKSFEGVDAVRDVSLDIEDGEFLVLVGPSGCGKTTLLRMVAGLESVSAGEIRIGDSDVTALPPKRRDVAMVFQDYALYPHLTVEKNLGIGLKLRGVRRAERKEHVLRVAKLLGLDGMLTRKPGQLSGGQRQRVAIGRAMVREPRVYLMDEPLSNLDAKLRVQMRAELSRLRDRLRVTTVYVTHDQVEAMTLGHRVAVMNHGVLQQVGTAQELFDHPANAFVAGFIGSPEMNLAHAMVVAGRLEVGQYQLGLPPNAGLDDGEHVIVGIRPSDFELAPPADAAPDSALTVQAEVTELLGSEMRVVFVVHARPAGEGARGEGAVESAEFSLLGAPTDTPGLTTSFTATIRADRRITTGTRLRLSVDPAALHFFDPDTGLAIGSRAAPARPPAEIVTAQHERSG
jgi:multiple sugar transport system ATP-binding protein